MISRETKRRRADLKKIRTIKCRHRIPGCEQFDCIKAIREAVYGGRKKKKVSKPVMATSNIEELFRRLRRPVEFERFSDFEDELSLVTTQPVLSIPASDQGQAYSEVERKLTLRQLIARKAA